MFLINSVFIDRVWEILLFTHDSVTYWRVRQVEAVGECDTVLDETGGRVKNYGCNIQICIKYKKYVYFVYFKETGL